MYNGKTDEEILEFFKTCTSKEKAYDFLGISKNISGTKRLEELNFVCGCVGYDSEQLNHLEVKKREKEEYEKNPIRCKHCGTPIPYEDRLTKKFCNSSCAAKFNNKGRVVTDEHKKKTSESVNKNNRIECNWKGTVYNYTKREAKLAYENGDVDIDFIIEFFPDIVKRCVVCGKYFVVNYFEKSKHFSLSTECCSDECRMELLKRVDWIYSRNSNKVSERIEKKKEFVNYKGGSCIVCGYNKCLSALEFHHLNPKEKDISITRLVGDNVSLEKAKDELDKCVLLCSNHHREVHAGLINLNDYINRGVCINEENKEISLF